MYKIEAIVKMNGHEAFVLNKYPVITYERYDKCLFGLDEYGVFANSYVYEAPGPTWQAFAGRKFDIPMVDGTVINATGQWWDGGTMQFAETLGAKITYASAGEINALKKCYVFSAFKAVAEELVAFRQTYKGKVYDYWEFEHILKKQQG